MRKAVQGAILALLIVGLSSSLALAGGMHLSGVGARAMAFGGAFRAIADDYSAVFWNPAGLYQVEGTKLDFTFVGIMPNLNFTIDSQYPAAPMAKTGEANNIKKFYPAGNAGITFDLGSWKAGFAIYALGGMGAVWDIFQEKPILGFADPLLGNPNGTNFPITIKDSFPKDEMESLIGIVSFHPALSKKINDNLAIGFGLNVNYGFITLKRLTSAKLQGADVFAYQDLSGNGIGFGFNAGFLYQLSEQLRFGASARYEFDIPVDADLNTTYHLPYNQDLAGNPLLQGKLDGGTVPAAKSVSFDLPRPLEVGAGLAFKPSDKLLLSFDVQYTQWSVVDKIEVGDNEEEKLTFDWENVVRYSVGGQYRVSDNFALRAGFYSDPSPAPDATLNPLLPDTNTKNALCLGFGYGFGKITLNVVGEYLLIPDRVVKVAPDIHGLPGTYKSKIPSFDINLSYSL